MLSEDPSLQALDSIGMFIKCLNIFKIFYITFNFLSKSLAFLKRREVLAKFAVVTD